jgi:hypothetical protein
MGISLTAEQPAPNFRSDVHGLDCLPRDPSLRTEASSVPPHQTLAVLPDHKQRPPRDRGNLARGIRGNPPLQVVD